MHHSVRRLLVSACAASLMSISGIHAFAQEDAVVATLNGQPITEADLALAESELDPQFGQLPAEQKRAAALSAIIDVRLFAAEAEKQQIDQSQDFLDRMEFLRERALHSAYIDQNVVGNITDEDVRARYDAEVADLALPEEVHARHILVETEEEAKDIIAQLDEGADFAELAQESSKDGAAANGGDLGYFTAERMVPEFSEAAFAMEPGTHSTEPVQTQFGWHVIKVEDKRRQQPPSFDQVENQVRSIIIRENYIEALAAFRNEAQIDIPDAELKNAVDSMLRQQLGADGGEEEQ
ncbi:peptidylprolyl isomerase [Chelativorans sp. Marseille-P2723]|uniref:peptidylprolyl isomerase n=1 Tax=Chelativorans sp. Marseille-P2723 TaxID=2709133 RepID=UPI00156EEE40|nr:peptidylprolyl isomerase [Chelativorans sp. Marseille-P2723]